MRDSCESHNVFENVAITKFTKFLAKYLPKMVFTFQFREFRLLFYFDSFSFFQNIFLKNVSILHTVNYSLCIILFLIYLFFFLALSSNCFAAPRAVHWNCPGPTGIERQAAERRQPNLAASNWAEQHFHTLLNNCLLLKYNTKQQKFAFEIEIVLVLLGFFFSLSYFVFCILNLAWLPALCLRFAFARLCSIRIWLFVAVCRCCDLFCFASMNLVFFFFFAALKNLLQT